MNSNPLIDRTVSSRDEMVFPGNEENYFEVGKDALEIIRLAQRVCNREWLPRILDLPCGHGRVLRWLRAAFDYADITACDLNRDGVNFCQQQFNATGVYSEVDLQKISFDPGFDLIWCGSLFTHLPLEAQIKTLDRLLDWTVEDGIIVLTLQGRFMATQLERGNAEFADNVDVVGLLRDFRTHGAAYRPYYEEPNGQYGLTLNSPAQINAVIQSKSSVIQRAYLEQAWGVQDVLILYKKNGFYSAVLS
ncbi:class I SAM-dependent methyltransferase [Opitutaceae bacterium]|nr:class I SAM-dependent methyltransferase [Opitutaceae bacterium]